MPSLFSRFVSNVTDACLRLCSTIADYAGCIQINVTDVRFHKKYVYVYFWLHIGDPGSEPDQSFRKCLRIDRSELHALKLVDPEYDPRKEK